MNRQICMAEEISRRLGPPDRWRVEVRHCVDSTNRVLKEAAAQNEPAGKVLIAEQQTAGRGRMGRKFFSPDQSGLYMSILLRPDLPVADTQLLTLAAAVAVAEAAEALTGRAIAIKWVNDLFLDGRKVCGILTESALYPTDGRLAYAVVGIGINLFPPLGGFPPELADIADSLWAGCPSDGADELYAALCAGILNRFAVYVDRLSERAFLEPYRSRSMVIGRRVTLLPGREDVLVTNIDDDGRLCVLDAAGERRIVSSGECSVLVRE